MERREPLIGHAEEGSLEERRHLGYGTALPVTGLIQQIDAAWSEWLAVLAAVPSDRIEERGVCEEWSVKDLLGHVAFWDRQVVDDIDGYEAMRPPLQNPWNDWNAADAARQAGKNVTSLRAEMLEAHRAMLDRLSKLESVDSEMVGVDTWEHYAEHTAHVRAWLQGKHS